MDCIYRYIIISKFDNSVKEEGCMIKVEPTECPCDKYEKKQNREEWIVIEVNNKLLGLSKEYYSLFKKKT
jgi:hypothetical protein